MINFRSKRVLTLLIAVVALSLLVFRYRNRLSIIYENARWTFYRAVSLRFEEPEPGYRVINAFPGVVFDRPSSIKFFTDFPGYYFVSELDGKVYACNINGATNSKKVIIDIQNFKKNQYTGLLDFAFSRHNDGLLYLYTFNAAKQERDTQVQVSRFRFDEIKWQAIRETQRVLFQLKAQDHEGGSLQIDKNNYLYISFGDGHFGDPEHNAQNLSSLHGKILRVKIGGADLYEIPNDNPFVKSTHKAKPEIYAYGFRNPFRMSIDDKTGDIFVGDVGHLTNEEINLVKKGGNYGWDFMEGNSRFRNYSSKVDTSTFIKPLYTYKHGVDGFSVTGGLVYHGNKLPGLEGKYIFGDYIRGSVWSFDYKNTSAIPTLILENAGNVTSFALSSTGRMYYSDLVTGTIKEITPTAQK